MKGTADDRIHPAGQAAGQSRRPNKTERRWRSSWSPPWWRSAASASRSATYSPQRGRGGQPERTRRISGRGAFPSLAPGQTFDIGQFAGRGGAGGLGSIAGGVSGTVQSVTPTSITIQEANGTSVTINTDGATTYHAAAAASAVTSRSARA